MGSLPVLSRDVWMLSVIQCLLCTSIEQLTGKRTSRERTLRMVTMLCPSNAHLCRIQDYEAKTRDNTRLEHCLRLVARSHGLVQHDPLAYLFSWSPHRRLWQLQSPSRRGPRNSINVKPQSSPHSLCASIVIASWTAPGRRESVRLLGGR